MPETHLYLQSRLVTFPTGCKWTHLQWEEKREYEPQELEAAVAVQCEIELHM